ncbi:mandelate racemase/muconate lactonizing enzyme family protein [Siccirubricoccus sp. KC 17139]|uniref:Mandelate racemase/muconate lactonizing enzyme family protein n=1 Tax=Siccirubricoccus soli TaxID=2899147 RepID=A0ABT1D1J3_9PROT|nr:mandelate racemase/muconate lactonizing enzyme family protein [Siccirubricoccus soli]MCO6415781.1 mandelate racemase/muconate lactonizing enzyme family protein [Siccirubricoccus soli]MCP2681913.1 mandelate racemase/muconate lactonizing enzyme family protein [Siccirubricoccus soli]
MTRIRDIQLVPVECAAAIPYGSSRGLVPKRGAGLIRLLTEDGIEGIGEAWGPAGVTRAYLDLVKPRFIGAELSAQRGVAQQCLAGLYHFGTANGLIALLGGIDIAAHDALGKRYGVSVAELIGGRLRERIPVYASGGYFTAEDDQAKALARQVERAAAAGHRAHKIKIGRNVQQDAARCALARRIIGPDAVLTVDGNGNYTASGALESMRRIADQDIHWYEEPVAPQDWAGYAELRDRAPIPVAAGEAHYALFDHRRLIDGRLAAVLQPDLTLCGGFEVGRTIGTLVMAEHLRLSPHCWGSGVGLAAALHLLAAQPAYPAGDHVPHPALLEYDSGDNALRDGVLREPLRYADGMLEVPKGPGLGITLDEAALRRFAPA